ncbi:MAG: NAD-dependent epimerase/dehydratase family protein [Rhodospirillales bacterium]
MTVLVTGAAGFIGFHTSLALLGRGQRVIGVDNLNDYYEVSLKESRLEILNSKDGFDFECLDISDREAVGALVDDNPEISHVVHLAAQAGVRYSLLDPYAYIRSNVVGHLVILEACRRLSRLEHLVYASSSSVYGANTKVPFSVSDRVDTPLSLYAATKRAGEVISHSYSSLYGLPQTGLRFFTVYGPWGRPDMAAFIFVKKILAGEPIPVFNDGDMRRDFTYIDDIVAGVLGCLDSPPKELNGGDPPSRLYNIGNHSSEKLMDYIALIEETLGMKAEIEFHPMQLGDVKETYADITDTQTDFGFEPKITIKEGIPRFVEWYREYYGV